MCFLGKTSAQKIRYSEFEKERSYRRNDVKCEQTRLAITVAILVFLIVGAVYAIFSLGSRLSSSNGSSEEEEVVELVREYFVTTYLNESWWSPDYYVWMIDRLLIPYLGIHEEFPWSTDNITVEVYPETFRASNVDLKTRSIPRLDLWDVEVWRISVDYRAKATRLQGDVFYGSLFFQVYVEKESRTIVEIASYLQFLE